VVLSFPALEPVETVTAQRPLTFPYVPGLLSFREAPVCLAAAENVQHPVDLWLIDGQGIAHPRRLGLASHVGLFLDAPAIGCAKSRLTGTYTEPGRDKGCFSDLRDHGETIGAVVRTRTGVRPLFVSPGHRCRLAEAVGYTLACTRRYRLPEPTRLAHQAVTAVKKG
jgi:deoxyribonuclease V